MWHLLLLLRLLIPVLSLSLLYVIVVKFIHDQVGGQSTKLNPPDSHDITVERLGCWWIPMNLSCLIFFTWKYQVGYIMLYSDTHNMCILIYIYVYIYIYWLVDWNINFMTFHSVGNFINPNWRTHFFQRGWYTTNQCIYIYTPLYTLWQI